MKVCVYGDGAFKDPVGGIWEWADPYTVVGCTDLYYFESTPNEIKIKTFADDQFKDLSGKELEKAVHEEIKKRKVLLLETCHRKEQLRDFVETLLQVLWIFVQVQETVVHQLL